MTQMLENYLTKTATFGQAAKCADFVFALLRVAASRKAALCGLLIYILRTRNEVVGCEFYDMN